MFFYNKKLLFLEEENKKLLNLLITELIKKIDFLQSKKEFIKNQFNLNDDEFKQNIYNLKTNAIMYCFYHPDIYKKKIFGSPKKKFNFPIEPLPNKFFKLGYGIQKNFNKENFIKFDLEVKNLLKNKKNIGKSLNLLSLLPILNRKDINLENSEKILKTIKEINSNK